jgi:thimet oligopeptidase
MRLLAILLLAPVLAGAKSPPATLTWTPALTPANGEQVKATCDAQLAAAEKARAKLEALPKGSGWHVLLRAYDNVYNLLTYPANDAYIVHATHPLAEVRKAADECISRASTAVTAFNMSPAVYTRLSAVEKAAIPPSLRYMVAHQLDSYHRNGVDRDAATRKRIAALQDEITAANTEFERNVSDDVRWLAVAPSELAGLPGDFFKQYPAATDGMVKLPVTGATFVPVAKYALHRPLRERMVREFWSRGYPANDAVLRRLMAARKELAGLLGYPDYASYDLANKMAQTPQKARAFLDDLAARARPAAQQEVERMLARLQRDDASIEALGEWDRRFAIAKISKEEYDVDPAALRRYLRYDKVQAGIFQLTQDLFGVSIRPWAAPVWAPSVRPFEMVENGRVIGRFYLDTHPRDGKSTAAEMAPIRAGVKGRSVPVAALITNFPEGLMEHSQVTTFLHEFGHLLHWVFSGQGEWAAQNDGELENDAIEAPSQLLEEWVYDYDTLKHFAVDDAGAPIPQALVEKLNASRRFGQASSLLNDMGFAAVSLDFHTKDLSGADLTRAFFDSQKTYALTGFPSGSHPQDTFEHLTGYGATYYTYAWSKALAWDLMTRFRTAGMRDRATAKAYRETILAPGGSESMNTLARRFLGRDWSVAAFQAELAGSPDGNPAAASKTAPGVH